MKGKVGPLYSMVLFTKRLQTSLGSRKNVNLAHSRNIHKTQLINISFILSISVRCVRRYESHVNRCHHCTAVFSPCGRFIATGSEDHCVSTFNTSPATMSCIPRLGFFQLILSLCLLRIVTPCLSGVFYGVMMSTRCNRIHKTNNS